MHKDGKCFGLAQRVFPIAAVGGTAKHAGETTLLAGIITADAGENIGLGHGTFLPGKILRHDILLREARQCDQPGSLTIRGLDSHMSFLLLAPISGFIVDRTADIVDVDVITEYRRHSYCHSVSARCSG